MFKFISSLTFLFLLCLSCKQAETSEKNTLVNDTGVALDMARYRNTQVKDVVYNLSFTIPEKKETCIVSQLL